VNALTTCFVSTSTAATACSTGRKKRHLDFDLEELDIKPSALRKDNEDLDDEFFDKDDTSVGELESTMELDHVKEEMNRKAKVLLYWLTTTTISTKYSYTQTFSVASVACTPTSWTISEC